MGSLSPADQSVIIKTNVRIPLPNKEQEQNLYSRTIKSLQGKIMETFTLMRKTVLKDLVEGNYVKPMQLHAYAKKVIQTYLLWKRHRGTPHGKRHEGVLSDMNRILDPKKPRGQRRLIKWLHKHRKNYSKAYNSGAFD